MEDIKVSIIVPIYNVEKFIARCVQSLMRQTLDGVEYIFVNDATPDRSMTILKHIVAQFPQRAGCVKVINLNKNEGLPAARNHGLQVAKGEYVFHCDSDDFVDYDMLENLYNTAIKEKADIVWCDWYLSLQGNERYMKQPSFDSSFDAVKAMLSGTMKFNVWNKLVRLSLYTDNGITFPSGYGMAEDMTMIILFAYAGKVCYLPNAYYHYVKTNVMALSRTYSELHLQELKYNVEHIELFIRGKYGNRLDKELSFMKLEAKFPFLLSEEASKCQLWREWFPEANAYIMKNKGLPLRSRILQWCAWKRLWWLVRGYSFLFNKVLYGIIYR